MTTKSEAKAKLKAIGERIAAISTLDLAEANELFLALCREELGTYQPRSGPRHAFMSHPAVKRLVLPQIADVLTGLGGE